MELKRDTWDEGVYNEYLEYLKSCADEEYKSFSEKIIPGCDNILGIRIPALRKIAKTVFKGNYAEFLRCERDIYHEEVIIAGLVRALKKCGYSEMLGDIIEFSEKITNWAVCDTVSFKGLKLYISEFYKDKDILIKSENPWQVRYGLGILMEFYLTDEYISEVLKTTENVRSDFYYVNMMQAWLIASAFAKYRDITLEFMKNTVTGNDVYKMAVRKICDSYKVSDGDKKLVKEMLRKR